MATAPSENKATQAGAAVMGHPQTSGSAALQTIASSYSFKEPKPHYAIRLLGLVGLFTTFYMALVSGAVPVLTDTSSALFWGVTLTTYSWFVLASAKLSLMGVSALGGLISDVTEENVEDRKISFLGLDVDKKALYASLVYEALFIGLSVGLRYAIDSTFFWYLLATGMIFSAAAFTNEHFYRDKGKAGLQSFYQFLKLDDAQTSRNKFIMKFLALGAIGLLAVPSMLVYVNDFVSAEMPRFIASSQKLDTIFQTGIGTVFFGFICAGISRQIFISSGLTRMGESFKHLREMWTLSQKYHTERGEPVWGRIKPILAYLAIGLSSMVMAFNFRTSITQAMGAIVDFCGGRPDVKDYFRNPENRWKTFAIETFLSLPVMLYFTVIISKTIREWFFRKTGNGLSRPLKHSWTVLFSSTTFILMASLLFSTSSSSAGNPSKFDFESTTFWLVFSAAVALAAAVPQNYGSLSTEINLLALQEDARAPLLRAQDRCSEDGNSDSGNDSMRRNGGAAAAARRSTPRPQLQAAPETETALPSV